MSTNFEELTENEVTSKITKSSKTRKKSTTKKSTKKSTAKSRKKIVNENLVQINEEQTQVIEVPTVEEPKRSLSMPTIFSSTSTQEEFDNQNKIDVITAKPKRTIKNIKPSKKTIEPEVIAKEKVKKISAPISKNANKKSNRPKRTLRLNLGNDEVRTVDTSINQNASFFYEPSVFEKYNISFTDADSESEQPLEIVIESIDSTTNDSITNDIESNENDISSLATDTSVEKNNLENVEMELSELENEIIIEIEKEIVEQQPTVVEIENEENAITDDSTDIETIESTSIEETENIETVDNTKTENIVLNETYSNEQAQDVITNESNVIEQNEDVIINEADAIDQNEDVIINEADAIDQNEDVIINEADAIEKNEDVVTNESDIIEQNKNVDENTIIENEIDTTSETEVKEVADSVSKIEKFWSSSIPSLSSTNINNTFSKIKNSIVSNISPIFKKFTYEQANLLRNIESDSDETITNTVPNVTTVFEEPKNINTPFTQAVEPNELNVSADDIVNLEVPTINTEATSSDAIELSEDDIYNVLSNDSNIITQKSDDEVEEIIKNNKKLNKTNKKQEQIIESISESAELDCEDLDTETLDEQNLEADSYDEYDTFDEYAYTQNKDNTVEDYNDDTFSIESYFGLDKLTDKDFESVRPRKKSAKKEKNETTKADETDIHSTTDGKNKKSKKEDLSDTPTITKLLESFNETISTLSDRISTLEDNNSSTEENVTSNQDQKENTNLETSDKIDETELGELLLNNSDLTDLISDDELLNSELENEIADSTSELLDVKETEIQNIVENDNNTVENILSETLSTDNQSNAEIKDMFKNELLAGITSPDNQSNDLEVSDDFLKVIDCLSKAISELESPASSEQTSETNISDNTNNSNETTPHKSKKKSKKAKQENESDLPSELISNDEVIEEGKSINILINKDDIFSISILNETYEIVADFDGISVLSENIHISTPKNNFFVKIGNKYIEIHNHKNHFIVHTNFEDVEFANAINNVGFAKKNNKIELNIKEAFKLASVNNKIELSMLNKTIASIKDTPVTQIDESSICDNKTLLISEETQKVYLPYTISEVMQKLKYNDEYQTVQEVVDNEYTVPLSTFRMPIISRFKEAYRFMRVKENSSVYAAIDLAVELMFNSNLNPAVIRAAKDLKELNIYLDCLYENEIEKFDCFKIIYKVLPKIK